VILYTEKIIKIKIGSFFAELFKI